jgi:urea transport system permease protein
VESFSDLFSILVMQGFNGLSSFSVLLLMALGLAIIFGQMGVINMAHGEFLTIGAYTTYVLSEISQRWLPFLRGTYFLLAIAVAFVIAAAVGLLVEQLMVRHLYRRPLDTLLATWGLSLIMQQGFRSSFGAKEVSATLPDWLMGSVQPTPSIDIPINGLFVMLLTLLLTSAVFIALFRTRWGIWVRATTQNRMMASAAGIDTRKIDRGSFALGCGLAGIAGAAFTTIGSTGPTSGSMYIVDTFLVVVFGGAESLVGTIASAFSIAQAQATSEFFMTGSNAKVLTLLSVILILMARPQGLFSARVRRS